MGYFLKFTLVFLLACGAIALIWQTTIYLIFRVLKKLSPSEMNETATKKELSPVKNEVTAIKWASASDCGTLISIRTSKSGKIFFYDLMGNRVSKIPRAKRDLAVQHDCFLGQRNSVTVVKWVPVKRSEVETQLNQLGFREAHSAPPLPSNKQKTAQNTSLQSMKESLNSSGFSSNVIEFMNDQERARIWIACHQVRHDGTPTWIDLSRNGPDFVFWQGIYDNTQVCSEGQITQGIGEFGLEPSNPIPVFGPPGAKAYLANLKSARDNEFIRFKRLGSRSVSNINYSIDRYSIMDTSGNQTELFLSCYHPINSHQAPSGFKLNARVLAKPKGEGTPLVTRRFVKPT